MKRRGIKRTSNFFTFPLRQRAFIIESQTGNGLYFLRKTPFFGLGSEEKILYNIVQLIC